MVEWKSPVPFKGKVTIGYRIGLFQKNKVIHMWLAKSGDQNIIPSLKLTKKKTRKKWSRLDDSSPFRMAYLLLASGRALPAEIRPIMDRLMGLSYAKIRARWPNSMKLLPNEGHCPPRAPWVAVGGNQPPLRRRKVGVDVFFWISTWWFVFLLGKTITQHFTCCFWRHHYNLGMNDNCMLNT